MAATTPTEAVDLLILVDATASMTDYLASLRQSLPQIISLAALTDCFDRIGLLAYRDYSDTDLLQWSGWMRADASLENQHDLTTQAGRLVATGGGDYPEATKTGLAQAYKVMRKDAETLILLYTDAPPHLLADEDNGYSNGAQEQAALLHPQSFDGYGPRFADWAAAAHALRGEKKARVICIQDGNYGRRATGHYNYLTSATGGACINLHHAQARHISEVTIEVLLAWMGVKKDGASEVSLQATLSTYKNAGDSMSLQSERDALAQRWFEVRGECKVDLDETKLTSRLLERVLPKKSTPLQDFTRTYKDSARYRRLATAHLRCIIERDVSAVTLNPVFGTLWRALCNDRDNEDRQHLLDLFGREVNAVKDADTKVRMRTWLEESYDFTAEVRETIAKVPQHARYPCVCLDPTLAFVHISKPTDLDEYDESNTPITSFRRDELLELGRSCDWRILRRLGRILTRLTYIESKDDEPAHIAATEDASITKVPLALASPQHGNKFWRILLHVVVPGTLLSGRAAALLAALSIRLGVRPLRLAAETETRLWRQRWHDIDIPETWNVNCLSLLLDADLACRNDVASAQNLHCESVEGLLTSNDRALFKRLVDYKMLELNLDTTLRARIGWTPDKTRMPLGTIIACRLCRYPRSVTVMGPDQTCGLCCFHEEIKTPSSKRVDLEVAVTHNDTEFTNACWVECSVQGCRAQYVVYNVEGLNVRPKCHYCRNMSIAPTIECTKCLSRIIWPNEYRCRGAEADFLCIGCRHDQETVVTVDTTANQLRAENGSAWLLSNKDGKIKQPFNGRTLFHTASTNQPLDDFCEKVCILPAKDTESLQLTVRGKAVRNAHAVLNELCSWVLSRRTENGTCSLCFTTAIRKDQLLSACGRSGCHQKVCGSCHEAWYGINAAGRVINTAALHCPFCRRAPTAKTLARHGIHAIADLRQAVEQNGGWIYAWCIGCGHARPFMERVCADGAPPEVERWTCDACRAPDVVKKLKTRLCPGCGIETEKTGGCDHIRCAVPSCEVDWCFHCGHLGDKDLDGEDIYEHMRTQHGGFVEGLDIAEECG